jgi:hypothetical protein
LRCWGFLLLVFVSACVGFLRGFCWLWLFWFSFLCWCAGSGGVCICVFFSSALVSAEELHDVL